MNNYLKLFNYKKSLGKTQNDRRSDRIKNFISGAKYIIFGPLFNPKQESEKLYTSTGGYDNIPIRIKLPRRVEQEKKGFKKVEKLLKNAKEEPPKDAKKKKKTIIVII